MATLPTTDTVSIDPAPTAGSPTIDLPIADLPITDPALTADPITDPALTADPITDLPTAGSPIDTHTNADPPGIDQLTADLSTVNPSTIDLSTVNPSTIDLSTVNPSTIDLPTAGQPTIADLPANPPTHLEIPIPTEALTYAMRIHYIPTCRCHRIPKDLPSQTVAGHDLIFVVERDRSFKNRNICPCFFNISIDSGSPYADAHQQLVTVFKDALIDRSIIHDYFGIYSLVHAEYSRNRPVVNEPWHPQAARLIRDLTRRVQPILLCNSDRSFNQQRGWNGGCAILGDRILLGRIANLFNNNVTKTEFQSLRSMSIKNLGRYIDRSDESVRALQRGTRTPVLQEMNGIFTLIGLSSRDNLYSVSFGKREWYDQAIECSKQCAMRELFEEFNIQLSPTALDNSRRWLNTNCISNTMFWSRGAIFYVIYIAPNTSLAYDPISETICVGY